jgi:hypothetical protein
MKVGHIKEKYYYVIDVYPHDYWGDVESRYPEISGQAVTDIREGRAKILVLFPNEGLRDHNDASAVLNTWAANYKLPHRSIVLVSGNYAYGENIKRDKCIVYIPYSVWEHAFTAMYNKKSSKKLLGLIENRADREKVFLSYNRRARYPRCKLVYQLQQRGLFDRGFVSLGKFTDYESRTKLPPEFLDTLPITFDDTDLEINHAHEIVIKDFMNSFVSLISETSIDPGEIFPTEKIFKSIVGLHPFILFGSPGFLEHLKCCGYKTFSKWFDESYDKEKDLENRIFKVVSEVEKVCSKSDEELKDMLVDMAPTLQHNLNTYLKRTSEKTFQRQLEEELWK